MMNVVTPKISEKPGSQWKTCPKPDFRYGAFNLVILILIMGIGAVIQLRLEQSSVSTMSLRPEVLAVVAASIMGSLLIVMPKWQKLIGLGVAYWVILRFGFEDTTLWPLHLSAYLGLLVSSSVQIAQQWERGVVLRLGKFRSLKGPGFFTIIPLIDRVDSYVDHRVRASDFRAETTLTRDTVPVNVDAIAFWLVWDAKMSVLEVENFVEAVILSAQTALRDAIGRHELAEMLTDREAIGKQIQKVLDKKTDPWGVTIQSIEIRDVVIPKGLEDAMSRQAQAERERQSRVILGTAETEIAAKFAKASEAYINNPVALHLRAMNMVFEGLKQKGSMVIVPSSAVETMGLGVLGGLTALAHTQPEGTAVEPSPPEAPTPPAPSAEGD